MKSKTALILSILFLFIVFNQVTIFNTQNSLLEREQVTISRIIDGDTLQLQDGRTLRLANINSPEKNSPLSSQSIEFMNAYKNKTVQIEITSIDKYKRSIARIYSYQDTYINLDLVENGLASKFLVHKTELALFDNSEKQAIQSGKGIWTHSDHYGCFEISIDEKSEVVFIENTCNLSLEGFTIKDESRKIYKFENSLNNKVALHTSDGQDTESDLFWKSETNIWNNDRDTAYLFDKENNIAGYYSYGY